MKKIPISRIHFGVSVYVEKREHLYLEESKTLSISYVPELNVIELTSSHKDRPELVHAMAYNVKWYLPKVATRDISDSGESNNPRSTKTKQND